MRIASRRLCGATTDGGGEGAFIAECNPDSFLLLFLSAILSVVEGPGGNLLLDASSRELLSTNPGGLGVS
jgi:hypothetical protein